MRSLLCAAFVAASVGAFAQNLVTNGNFEASPSNSGWTESSSGNYTIIGDWNAGTGGAVTTNSAWLGGYNSATDFISQSVFAPAGTNGGVMTFGLTRYTVDDENVTFLRVTDDGNEVGAIDLGDNAVTSYQFSPVTIPLLSGFGSGSHLIAFTVSTGSLGASSAFVDNVSIVANPVPEPASLAALGLGAAALLRRRRA